MPCLQAQMSQKHLYPSLTSYVDCVTSFFAFLPNIYIYLYIVQRSVSWSQLNNGPGLPMSISKGFLLSQ